jgi:hypothetical protein
MNARVCKRLRRVIWPKGGPTPKMKDRQHHAIMEGRKGKPAVRPTCVCDSNRRTYQRAKMLWQQVPKRLRRIAQLNVRSVSQ